MNLNLTHLLNFIQIVEWGNISKAAAFLNIAQPALSRQMHALENSLGTKLLRRQSWGIEPTEDGKLLLEHANRIQKECIAAQENVQSNRNNPVGHAYLGVPAAYAITLVPPLMQRMRKLYPGITVHVVEAFSGTIYEWLLSGRLDLAILYYSREHDVPESLPFIEENLVALGPPGRYGNDSIQPLSELANRQLIAAWRPHLHRLNVDAAFLSLDMPFEPLIETDSMTCMIELAHQGDGIATLPRSCVACQLQNGRLTAAELDPTISMNTALGRTPGQQTTRAVRILMNTLRELALELAPKTGWKVSSS